MKNITTLVLACIAGLAYEAAAATITLTANSAGHVWAQLGIRYDQYLDEPHVGDESFGTSRGYLGFPITASQLSGATINSVTLYIACKTASSSSDYVLRIRPMRVSHSSAQDLWNDAGDGTAYVSSAVAGRSSGWQSVNLFAQAAADLQSLKTSGEATFPLGLEADGKGAAVFYGSGVNAPYVIVDYTPAEFITPPDFIGASAADLPDEPGPQNIAMTIRCPTGSSSYGHSLQYQFDFGDGNTSGWLSGRSTSHTYPSAGSWQLKVQARCATHTDKVSAWSGSYAVRVRTPTPTLNKTLIDFGTNVRLGVVSNGSFGIYDSTTYYSVYNNTTVFTWTASDNQTWLSESPTAGGCKGSGTTNVSVSINTTGLAYDTLYSGTITVVPTYGANKTLTVQFRTQPHSVSTPSTPTGASPVATGDSQTYSTGGASCTVAGHSVQYRFDWDDGSFSSWSASSSAPHSWGSAGTYQVKAQARCATDNAILSSWSSAKSVSAVVHSITAPSTPSGPTSGYTGQNYSFASGGSSCPIGHSLEYHFSWGDGVTSSWSSASSALHSWTNAGNYGVACQARCSVVPSILSAWSSTGGISIENPPPEITVLGAGGYGVITDGDTRPTPSDGTDFGTITQGVNTASVSFTVRNDGGSTLTLGAVSVPTGFTLTEGLSSSLAPGASDTFTVRLDNAIAGVKSGDISFSNNDSDENPFNFGITGNVLGVPYSVRGILRDLFSGGPIENATVEVWRDPGMPSEGLVVSTNTDASGHFTFQAVDPANWNIEVRVSKPGYVSPWGDSAWFKQHMNPQGTIYENASLRPASLAGGRFLEVRNDRKDVSFEFPPSQPNSIILHNNRDLYLGIEVVRSRSGQPDVTLLAASGDAAILGPKQYWIIPSSTITVTDPSATVGDTYRVRVFGGGYDQPGQYDVFQKHVTDKTFHKFAAAIVAQGFQCAGISIGDSEVETGIRILWDSYDISTKLSGKSLPEAVQQMAIIFAEKALTDKNAWGVAFNKTPEQAARLASVFRVAMVLPRTIDLIGDAWWGGQHGLPRQQDLYLLRTDSQCIIPELVYWNATTGADFDSTVALPTSMAIQASFQNYTGRTLNNVWVLVDVFDPSGRHIEATTLPAQDPDLLRYGAIQFLPADQGQTVANANTAFFHRVQGVPLVCGSPGYSAGDYLVALRLFENGYPGQAGAAQVGPTYFENLHFGDTLAPGTVTNLNYDRDSDGSLVLAWNKVEYNADGSRVFDFDRYELWRRAGAGASSFLAFVDNDQLQNRPLTYRDRTANPAQQYVYKVRSMDLDGHVGAFSMELNVPANLPPAVAITSPSTNDTFSAGANISIIAGASDADGTVTQICLYTNTALLQCATSAPFAAVWAAVPAGTYDLTARAWDNFGAQATSAPVRIFVVSQSHWVSTPNAPSGPDSGLSGQSLPFAASGSACNQGHAVQHQFGWGDGTSSPWSSSPNSQHSWVSSGTFEMHSQARCAVSNSIVSGWSSPKYVLITNLASDGAIQINIGPAGAISAGAQWQVDGDAWQNSGSVVSGLVLGNHTLSFKPVTGWVPPPSQSVVVTAGTTNVVSAAYTPAGISRRATLFYACNQAGGTSVTDSSGSNTGTLDDVSAAFFSYSAELGRYCIKKLDSSTAGLTPAFRPVSNATFTVSCWAKPAVNDSYNAGQFFMIDSSPEKTYRFDTDTINYQYSGGGSYPNKYGYFARTGGWHHFAWANQDNGDGTANLRMYVDGVKVFDGALSSSEYSSTVAVNQKFLVQRPWSVYYYQFIGEICNIAVFNGTALSDAEMSQFCQQSDPRPAYTSVLLEDHFDPYPLNAWPTNLWAADANAVSAPASNRVEDSPSQAGNSTLHLYGVLGSYWAALAYAPCNFTNDFYVAARVYNGTDTIPSSGHQWRGSMGMRHGTSWTGAYRGFIAFSADGNVNGGELGTFSTGRWYDLKIHNQRNGTNVTLTYWIDGAFKGSRTDTISDLNQELSLDHLELQASAGSAWFDDIKVYTLAPAAVRITSLQVLPGGSVRLAADGEIGTVCQVERSANLLNWTPSTLFTNTPSSWQVTNSPAGSGVQFYRLKLLNY